MDRQRRGSSQPSQRRQFSQGNAQRQHQQRRFNDEDQRGRRSQFQQNRPQGSEGQSAEPSQSTPFHQYSTEAAHSDKYERGDNKSRSSCSFTRGRGSYGSYASGNFQKKPKEFSRALSKFEKPILKPNIDVFTNFFVIEKFINEAAYHYDVTFEPERPKRLFLRVLEEFRNKNFPSLCLSFDGKQNLYLSEALPFDQNKIIKDSVKVYNEERKREEKFTVSVKFVARIDLSVINQRCLQVLDIILGSGAGAKGHSVGRIYFPHNIKSHSLGGGYEIRSGLFLSVKNAEKRMVNFDVCNKVFLRSQSVLDLIKELLSKHDIPANYRLDDRTLPALKKVLCGSKVKYSTSKDLGQFIGTFNVWDILTSPVNLSFKLENGENITVLEYFEKHKKTPVKYKNLPCLNLDKRKLRYVPLEFCYITEGQVVHIEKLNTIQSTAMIKQTATSTIQRMEAITDMLEWFDLNNSLQARVFDFRINMNFLQTVAHILVPPTIQYRETSVMPKNGKWFTTTKFIEGSTLKKWAVLYIQDNQAILEDVTKFVQLFIEHGNKHGMRISEPHYKTPINSRKIGKELEYYMKEYKDYDLIFIIGVDYKTLDGRDVYSCVKATAELKIQGVLTQCIKAKSIRYKCHEKIPKIVEKVNKKLGGINNILHQRSSPMDFGDCMFVGADVTHPTPKEREMPSVSAVCASFDETGTNYGAQIRLQESGKEIIENLEEMMVHHLKFYEARKKKLPRYIFFFRDGVGDGDFQKVSQKELVAIQKACSSLQKDYKPAISLVIVQKRHHIRLFPVNKEDEVGKNGNVPPGTVVDSCIVQKPGREYFLLSHLSSQGVSRPTKYCILHDDNSMSVEDFEKLTYSLCHLYSRCTQSVSYPAPTYLAHHAASRGKTYILDFNYCGASNRDLQKLFSALDKLPSMYYT